MHQLDYYTSNAGKFMDKTLMMINDLKKKKLIKDYAIGGGIAAMFYIEPILTYDLDVFVITPKGGKSGKVINLTSLYDFLEKKKCTWRGEHIIVKGVPVQFIPVDELEEEAVRSAKVMRYKGVHTKVITPEYLVAIFLRAGRKKDLEKVERLLTQADIEMKKLKKIVHAYGLEKKLSSIMRGKNA